MSKDALRTLDNGAILIEIHERATNGWELRDHHMWELDDDPVQVGSSIQPFFDFEVAPDDRPTPVPPPLGHFVGSASAPR